MRYKQTAVVLVVLSLMAIMFVSAVAAQVHDYYPYMIGTRDKKANALYLTIDTTSDTENGAFDGRLVVPDSIIVTAYSKKDPLTPIVYDSSSFDVDSTEDSITINFHVVEIKDYPKKVIAANAIGALSNGETFKAAGPGWGYRWG